VTLSLMSNRVWHLPYLYSGLCIFFNNTNHELLFLC
jgi:hypothetical protein